MKIYVLFSTDKEDSYSIIEGVFSSFEKARAQKEKEWSDYTVEYKYPGAEKWEYTSQEHPVTRGSGFVLTISETTLDETK